MNYVLLLSTVQESSAVKDGPLCALCEYVMQTLDDKLDANATKVTIHLLYKFVDFVN